MQSAVSDISDSSAASHTAPQPSTTRYCEYIECGKPLDPSTYRAATGEIAIHPTNTDKKRFCNASCRIANYWYLNAKHPNAPRRIHEQRLADDKLYQAAS